MPSPIRVAQVVGKMVGGGVEQVLMNYHQHIDRDCVQFDFLVDSDSTFVPEREIESRGGRVFQVPPYQSQFAYQRELGRLFYEQNWPIVHSHINALSVFPLYAAKRACVPVRIAHSHSTSGKGEWGRNAAKVVLKHFANCCPTDRMACGGSAGRWLFGKGAAFEIVPNAIDIAAFEPNATVRISARRELGISDNEFVVGHIGRFVAQKNHLFLLHVFKEVIALEPKAVLLLIGEGPLRPRMEQLAQDLGIKGAVHFLGARGDVSALYQAFDVFCLPSLYEGFPVVSVECQASGTPMLVSDEVTHEAAVTSLVDFEPLSVSSCEWAKHLLSMKGRSPNGADRKGLDAFDIRCAALCLAERYVALADEARAR